MEQIVALASTIIFVRAEEADSGIHQILNIGRLLVLAAIAVLVINTLFAPSEKQTRR